LLWSVYWTEDHEQWAQLEIKVDKQ
jgi:hypothetical protein